MEQRTRELEGRGALVGRRERRMPYEGGIHVPGAMKRFLEERRR